MYPPTREYGKKIASSHVEITVPEVKVECTSPEVAQVG